MIIQLDSKTRINGTETCWQLERPRLEKGSVTWRPYKYFSTLGAAVQEAAHAEIRTSPATTIVEALDAVRAVSRKYCAIVNTHMSGLQA